MDRNNVFNYENNRQPVVHDKPSKRKRVGEWNITRMNVGDVVIQNDYGIGCIVSASDENIPSRVLHMLANYLIET